MEEYVEAVVGPDGSIKYEAIGYKGASCEQATQYIRDALAGGKLTEEKTADYYVEDKQKVSR